MQKVILAASLFLLSALAVHAQADRLLRYNCMAPGSELRQEQDARASNHSQAVRAALPILRSGWDSTRVYPVAVVLVAFADRDFSMDDPYDRYNRIFNEEGYNEGAGAGCVADYFRTQSGGLFKPRFDIYGPVKVSAKSNKYDRYGSGIFHEALKILNDSLHLDFSVYDWDADGSAEYVVFIYAGFGGNEISTQDMGYIWPNTGTLTTINIGATRAKYYTASAEMWSNNRLCGIGTVCHEYTHTLGLPDIYPTIDTAGYSVCDQWDLMDGGNFTNNGWCPPNFTALEKILMGWGTPLELTEPTTITDMKPVSQGGTVYLVTTTDADEFFLLENRQWEGWDKRAPGHGLLISHVHYNASAWRGNYVNNTPAHRRFDLVHADNLDYDQWEAIIGDNNPYKNGHNQLLSGTVYPHVNDTVTNNALTDTSVPAATTFTGKGLLSKPITDIVEAPDGTISFTFMADISGVIGIADNADAGEDRYYDLQGRRVSLPLRPGLYVRNGRKQVIR